MKNRLFSLLFLLGLSGLTNCAESQPIKISESQSTEIGVLYPESFGAIGDGKHDDTPAIQSAIDSLVKMGGGIVRMSSGTYLIKSIKLGPKVSLIGNGNGATVIKQSKGQKEHCIVVRDVAAALKIADLTVIGENSNSGIFFEESGGFGENHHYLYSNTSTWDKSQAYKWITIDNVCVYKFETGLDICKWGFNINICNSTFSHNGNGVIMKCTDSFMYNCYVSNNRKNGLVVVGGDDKINNVKSIFNGIANAKDYGGIVIQASRCQIMNCETQDNYCKGFVVRGEYNLFSNCMSNTDGYSREPQQYDPTIEACGFLIKGLYNTFSNCAVMNYNEKYGAVYHTPVIIDESILYYYPDIFDNIKILNSPDRLMFNEPFYNVQALAPKNHVNNPGTGMIGGNKYFVLKQQFENYIKTEDLHLSSLQLLIDFKNIGYGGQLFKIDGDNSLSVNCEKASLILYWQGRKEAELKLDDDVVMDKDDLRLVVFFSQYRTKRYINMHIFEKTTGRGWVKKEMRKETSIPSLWINKATVMIGDVNVPVKRLVVTQSPLPESVFLPSSNTNKIYDSAIVYVDADSYE